MAIDVAKLYPNDHLEKYQTNIHFCLTTLTNINNFYLTSSTTVTLFFSGGRYIPFQLIVVGSILMVVSSILMTFGSYCWFHFDSEVVDFFLVMIGSILKVDASSDDYSLHSVTLVYVEIIFQCFTYRYGSIKNKKQELQQG